MTVRLVRWLQQIGVVFLVLCIGTVFDWMAHHLSPRFGVPSYYFRNKLLFGTIIGFIALRVFHSFIKSERWLAFWSMLGVSVLLQTRYYFEGYDLSFVLIFMVIHFVVFFIPAFMLFPKFRRIL